MRRSIAKLLLGLAVLFAFLRIFDSDPFYVHHEKVRVCLADADTGAPIPAAYVHIEWNVASGVFEAISHSIKDVYRLSDSSGCFDVPSQRSIQWISRYDGAWMHIVHPFYPSETALVYKASDKLLPTSWQGSVGPNREVKYAMRNLLSAVAVCKEGAGWRGNPPINCDYLALQFSEGLKEVRSYYERLLDLPRAALEYHVTIPSKTEAESYWTLVSDQYKQPRPGSKK